PEGEMPVEAPLEDIVGKSPAMLDVYKLVARVAPTAATVLVVGESGTGKELVARAIHEHSPRNDEPFVPVNCTALTESLLESELFGHAKGAFTGAQSAKRGLFEEAHGGTLFLDEIGDMGAKMQAQLLRALQDGEIRRVGGNEAIQTDVRVVCATNRDLEAEVRGGRFRAHLTAPVAGAGNAAEPLSQLAGDRPTLAELERRYIELILSETGGNKKRAAEILGIDRRTLYRTLDREKSSSSPSDDDE